MKKLFLMMASISLATKLPAGVTTVLLSIQTSPAHTVTVTANGVSTIFPHVVLLTSTNLPAASWVAVQTNIYGGAGPEIFPNIPAKGTNEFFMVKTY